MVIGMTGVVLFFARKLDKERLLACLHIYNNIKLVINFLLARLVMRFFMQNNFLVVLSAIMSCVFFVLISIFDSFLIFIKVKKLRKISSSNMDYIWSCFKNYFLIYAVFLVFSQIRYLTNDAEDYVFFVVYMSFIWIYQFISPYIIMGTNKVHKFANEKVVNKLQRECAYKYKLFCYEGKKTKAANAITTGMFFNRHIFVSDYFIENATAEELFAILCHECAHNKYCDIEKRMAFINICMLMFFITTCVMDYLKIKILPGLIFIVVSFVAGIIIYRKLQQFQEYRADKYSVYITGDKDSLIAALEKLYFLNDMKKKDGFFLSLLSTHPQLQKRKDRIYHDF